MARHTRRGLVKIYFVDEIADIEAPAEDEFDGALEIECELSELSGFSYSSSTIDTPDLCSTFVPKIPGEDQADDSSITFYEHNDGNPIKAALAKGTEGFIVFFPYGVTGGSPTAGDEVEVWPVQVASNSREWSAGNEPARYVIEFTVTSAPAQDVEVVA